MRAWRQKSLLIPDSVPFVNADEVAKELHQQMGGAVAEHNIAAGRLVLAHMDELQRSRMSFSTEINLVPL